ncbi:MAG: hypothetical protein ABI870_09570 [Rhodanobacter sp.]
MVDDDATIAPLVSIQPVSGLHAKLFLSLLVHAQELRRLILPSLLVHLLVRFGEVLALLLQIGRQLCLALLGTCFRLLCVQLGRTSGIAQDLIGVMSREVLGKSVPRDHRDDQARDDGPDFPRRRHGHCTRTSASCEKSRTITRHGHVAVHRSAESSRVKYGVENCA